MSIASEIARIQAAKSDIATAIANKGVTVPSDTLLGGYSALINSISGSSWTQIASTELTLSYSSTSAAKQLTIELPASAYTSGKILCVEVRDKAGRRNGYFLGSDSFFINSGAANGTSGDFSLGCRVAFRVMSNGTINAYGTGNGTGYGIYCPTITKDSITEAVTASIYARYGNTFPATIDGTYSIKIYLLDYSPTGNPFS